MRIPANSLLSPRALTVLVVLVAIAASFPVTAEDPGIDKQRRDILRFGIESEILALLDTLAAEKETRYDEIIFALLLESRSPKLKTGILAYFKKCQNPVAAAFAAEIIVNRDLHEETLVREAFSYLAEIKSGEGISAARDILSRDERKYLSLAIKLIGRSGGAEDVQALLAFLERSPGDNYEQESILALGELRAREAIPVLEKLLRNPDKLKFTRAYACKALAATGGASVVEAILWATTVDDPILRTAAVEALSEIDDPRADAGLLAALRDPYVKVRIAAAKACAKRKPEGALEYLAYKAKNDPEQSVKDESFKAIAEFGTEGIRFLTSHYLDEKNTIASRTLCWKLVAAKDPVKSSEFLTSTLEKEAANKDQTLYKKLVAELFQIPDPALSYLIRRFFADKDSTVRMAALEWARRAKAYDLVPDILALSTSDPVEMVRKRALDVLSYLQGT